MFLDRVVKDADRSHAFARYRSPETSVPNTCVLATNSHEQAGFGQVALNVKKTDKAVVCKPRDRPMRWISIELSAPAARHDVVCALLEGAGALSITSGDAGDRPVLEPAPGETPLWPQVRVSALFDGDYDAAPLLALLTAAGVEGVVCRQVADQDWARSGQDVMPRHFGWRLWVCPTDVAPPVPDALVLRLDAGLAFGTGSHATTGLCLRWLARRPLADLEVIDYGCGSGILAVAAALLGARQVWAVDIDPQALRATTDNAARNGVIERLQVVAPEHLPMLSVDLMVANILAPILVDLAPRFISMLRPGGALLLSGVLESQVVDVVAAFGPRMKFLTPVLDQGWACIEGIRQ